MTVVGSTGHPSEGDGEWEIGVPLTHHTPTLVLTSAPATRRAWLAELLSHREVMVMLARKEFQTRYKRASFGIMWSVALPLIQAVVMAIVFSQAFKLAELPYSYAAFVMSGILPWSYFASTLTVSSTAIVDGTGLTDKVWFPRALLPLVSVAANLVGLLVSTVILVALMPLFDTGIEVRLFLLVPAIVLLVAFSAAIALVVSALHVYFRDVKFIVQALLVVWLYLTPVLFPQERLKGFAPLMDFNPVTGVVALFHQAVIGGEVGGTLARPVLISVAITVALLLLGMEIHRRHDRLFVDLL